MPIVSTPCRVLHGSVTRLTDLEGNVTRVFCPHLDAARRICRLKHTASSEGPLAQLFERIDEGTLDSRDTRCDLW